MTCTRFAVAAILLCSLFGCARVSKFSIQKAPFIPPPDDYVGEVWRLDSGAASVEFSPDSKHVVIGNGDGFARVWNVESGKLVSELGPHGNLVWRSALLDFLVRIIPPWDAMGASLWWKLLSDSGEVYDATFSPDGNVVLTGSCDGTARLWEAQSGRAIRTFCNFENSCISRVAFAPDGHTAIVVTGEDVFVYDADTGTMPFGVTPGDLLVWELENGRELKPFAIDDGARSRCGRYLVTRELKRLTIWDRKEPRNLRTVELGRGSGIAFSPNGERILCGVSGRDAGESFTGPPGLVLLDLRSGEEICKFESARGWLTDLDISPNGRLAAAIGFGDGSVRIWKLPGIDQELKTSPATASADE